jgi:hypothetical protein
MTACRVIGDGSVAGVGRDVQHARLSTAELEDATRPRRWGPFATLACGIALPIVSPFAAALTLLLGFYVATVKLRKSYRNLGQGQPLGVELLAALVVIPVVGLVGSIGTSYSFYLWSLPGARDGDTAWTVMSVTVTVSLTLIIGMARVLARHQSGKDVLPFEPGTDPNQQIEALRKLRKRRPSGFLPGAARFGIERSNEALARSPDDKQPTLWSAMRSILSGTPDKYQVAALVGCAAVWVAVAILSSGRWWYVLLAVALGLASVIVAAGVGALTDYYDRLRWARREANLYRERDLEQDPHGAVVERLALMVEELADEVRRLRSQTVRPSPRSRIARWLSR